MSKIIEDLIRETMEQTEREVQLEVLKSGERSVADIAYADDMTEEEVRNICEENNIPIPQCEDYLTIPKTPAQAEALLRDVMANTADYPSIDYYAAKMLKMGLLDKDTVAQICMLSRTKADESITSPANRLRNSVMQRHIMRSAGNHQRTLSLYSTAMMNMKSTGEPCRLIHGWKNEASCGTILAVTGERGITLLVCIMADCLWCIPLAVGGQTADMAARLRLTRRTSTS